MLIAIPCCRSAASASPDSMYGLWVEPGNAEFLRAQRSSDDVLVLDSEVPGQPIAGGKTIKGALLFASGFSVNGATGLKRVY